MPGSWWDFLVTDVTLGASGNAERMAYLYDLRKLNFTGLAAELVLPREKNATEELVQMARLPYLSGSRAAWACLTLATVHIYYGKGVAVDARRLAEITAFSKTLARHASSMSGAPQYAPDQKPVADNLIVQGDFNIFNRKEVTMEAISQAGFVVPPELQSVSGSNVDKNKHCDQIAHHQRLTRLKPKGKAGIFDFFEHVYRLPDGPEYAPERA